MRRCLFLLLAVLCCCPPAAAQHSDAVDDVLQHLPMASVLVLKAAGVGGDASWAQTLTSCAAAYVVGIGLTYGLKHGVSELRPDHSDRRSFPSGHSMFAFAGATALRHECGSRSVWIPVAGYTVATLVAADRVRRDRHYAHDVLAGAAIGTLSAELSYYLTRKVFRHPSLDVAVVGTQLSVSYSF